MEEKLMFDHTLLRDRILDKYKSFAAFARAVGWKRQYLSRKLNSDVYFTRKEIVMLSQMLDIELCDIGAFFFTVRV